MPGCQCDAASIGAHTYNKETHGTSEGTENQGLSPTDSV